MGWGKETEIGPQALDSCSLEGRKPGQVEAASVGVSRAVWSGQGHLGEYGGRTKLRSCVCEGEPGICSEDACLEWTPSSGPRGLSTGLRKHRRERASTWRENAPCPRPDAVTRRAPLGQRCNHLEIFPSSVKKLITPPPSQAATRIHGIMPYSR